jgi:hypothetical protein
MLRLLYLPSFHLFHTTSTPHHQTHKHYILPLPPCSVVLTYWQHGGELQVELAGVHRPHNRRGPGGDDPTRHQSLEISVTEGGEEKRGREEDREKREGTGGEGIMM